MTGVRVRLGVDFGTSTTVAMVQRPGGPVQPLLFDGSPLLPSAVLAGPDGRLHTGRDAAHLARSAPERLEPNPKRRIDDGEVLLGSTRIGVRDLIAAVLDRVVAEAARVVGPVGGVVLTHPANWGPGRRSVLVEAARRIRAADIALVSEPVAAATYYASTRGDLPVGAHLLVYDLGAGTCDVTLLRRQPDGFAPVASRGLNDVGGLDVDAAVVAFLQASLGRLWTDPATRRRLWEDVRSAKEMLSRASGTVVMIPALDREVPLGREQLETLARPVLRPTIAMTREMLVEAGVEPATIAGLFLVGGASRMPLVATMLHEALGVPPVVTEQPELVVAQGSLWTTRDVPAAPTAPPGPPMSHPPPAPLPPVPAATPVPRAVRPRAVALAVAAVLLLAVGAVVAYPLLRGEKGDDGRSARDRGTAGPSGTGPAADYDLRKLPADSCAFVDLRRLAARYPTVASTPTVTRTLSAIDMDICRMSRSRTRAGGVDTAELSFSAYVFANVDLARSYHRDLLDRTRRTQTVIDVSGLGEEAFRYEQGPSPDLGRTELRLHILARDGNLHWSSMLTAARSDGGGWTRAEKRDLQAELDEAARASYAKVVPALR